MSVFSDQTVLFFYSRLFSLLLNPAVCPLPRLLSIMSSLFLFIPSCFPLLCQHVWVKRGTVSFKPRALVKSGIILGQAVLDAVMAPFGPVLPAQWFGRMRTGLK